MAYTMRILLAMALLLSVNMQAQKKHASNKDMGKLYDALRKAATLPTDRDAAYALAGKPITIELEITKEGKLVGTEVLDGTGTHIDGRLVAAITKFKTWNPSTLDGKAVDDKVKFNMYYNDACEFRTGRMPIPIPAATKLDMARYVEQSVLPAVREQLGNEGGRMAIGVRVNSSGEVKTAELISLFARGCGKQLEELLKNIPVKLPRVDDAGNRLRYYEFRFLVSNPSGQMKVQPYTEAVPVGGFWAFNEYVNKSLDSKSLDRYNVPEALFDVDADGNLVNVKQQRKANDRFDAQFVKTLQNAPRWIPATVDGKAVKVGQRLGFRVLKTGKFATNWQQSAEFPGGSQALAKFTTDYLNKYKDEITSSLLNVDEKIQVKWLFDLDGNLKSYDALKCGNTHVLKAIEDMSKDMPQWSSSMVNGVYTSTAYYQTLDLYNYKKK